MSQILVICSSPQSITEEKLSVVRDLINDDSIMMEQIVSIDPMEGASDHKFFFGDNIETRRFCQSHQGRFRAVLMMGCILNRPLYSLDACLEALAAVRVELGSEEAFRTLGLEEVVRLGKEHLSHTHFLTTDLVALVNQLLAKGGLFAIVGRGRLGDPLILEADLLTNRLRLIAGTFFGTGADWYEDTGLGKNQYGWPHVYLLPGFSQIFEIYQELYQQSPEFRAMIREPSPDHLRLRAVMDARSDFRPVGGDNLYQKV
jgi:hypothetical protein